MLKKILYAIAFLMFSYLVRLMWLVWLVFSGAPELSEFDTAQIRLESEALLNDNTVAEGYHLALPDQYEYINNVEPTSIIKKSDRIYVVVWESFTADKSFILFARDSKPKFGSIGVEWKKIGERFYWVHTDD